MKLSELVNYRNALDAMSSRSVQKSVDTNLEQIDYLIRNQTTKISNFDQQLQQNRANIEQAFDSYESVLNQLKLELKQLIETTEKPWFAESYRLYEQEMVNESAEYILNRRPNILPETEQFYKTRIVRYNDWKQPAMIIRPGRESYIHDLLASDPLYIVDESHDLLLPAMTQFNEVYQNRLRPYTINERSDQEILGKFPEQQFGLIFAYNFFNFKPFEVLKKYLSEIYTKLRPGGYFVMTFNDCDRDKGVMLVERHFCCYTPGYLVKELAQSIGFEIAFSWTDEGPSTWLELQKPGNYVSLRGGQTLAKIIPK